MVLVPLVLEDAKRRFIQERNRFGTGWGEVSWIKGIYETFVMLYIAASVTGYSIPNYLFIVLPVVCVGGLWFLGYLWDKSHMNHISREYSNDRDYFVEDVKKALRIKKRKTFK